MKQMSDYTELILAATRYLGYLFAADYFCKKYLKITKGKELLFVIFSFSGWLLFTIVNQKYPIPYILLIMLGHICFMGLVLLLFQAEKEKKFLAASMLVTVYTLLGNFCSSFFTCLALFLRHTEKKTSELLLVNWESELILYGSYVIVIAAVYGISKHLTSVFYAHAHIKNKVAYSDMRAERQIGEQLPCPIEKPGNWYVTLAVPLLGLTAVTDVANWGASNGIMVKSQNNMGLYYDQIFSHTEICVLTGLSMLAAGFYVFGMERIYLEQEKSSRYHAQIAVYEMLEEQYRQSERLRHDMKNHIIALSGLFLSKEWEKLGDYLEKLGESGLKSGSDMTGNKAVDALLYQKRKRAEQEKIKWECDVQIPKACSINEFDLCVLFGNILDNALEACERLGSSESHCRENCFISVQARTVKKCFLLEVKNSMDKNESYKNGRTSKENSLEHGIGLLNVRDVAGKYNGAVNIESEKGIFVISILLPLPECRI